MALRAEGDHFLGLIRILNQAAVGRDKGEENDTRFRSTRAEMHTSVERMGELAGKDAFAEKDPFTEVETVVIEAPRSGVGEVEENGEANGNRGHARRPERDTR